MEGHHHFPGGYQADVPHLAPLGPGSRVLDMCRRLQNQGYFSFEEGSPSRPPLQDQGSGGQGCSLELFTGSPWPQFFGIFRQMGNGRSW